MTITQIILVALGIGLVSGLRTFSPIAVVSWGAHWNKLNLHNSGLAFIGSTIAAWILLVFGVGELIADKMPSVPNRTTPGPFFARIVMGAVCGAMLSIASNQGMVLGVIAGACGAVAGTLAGFKCRQHLVRTMKIPDWIVAAVEDLICIGGAIFIVSRF